MSDEGNEKKCLGCKGGQPFSFVIEVVGVNFVMIFFVHYRLVMLYSIIELLNPFLSGFFRRVLNDYESDQCKSSNAAICSQCC